MNQFRGADWGGALGSGILKGMAIGNQVRASKAQYDYSNAADAAKEQYDADMKAAGDDQQAQMAAAAKRDASMSTARQNYHTYLGDVDKADAAYRDAQDADYGAKYISAGEQDPYALPEVKKGTSQRMTEGMQLGGLLGNDSGIQWGQPVMVASNGNVPVMPADSFKTEQGVPTGANGNVKLNTQVQMNAPKYDAKGAAAYLGELQAGFQKDPTSVNDALLAQINADPLRSAQEITFKLTGNGQFQMYDHGKPSGGPQPIPAQMYQGMVNRYLNGQVEAKFGKDPNVANIAAGGVGSLDPTAPASGEGGQGYRDRYNTQLSPEDEAAYQAWAKQNGRENDVEDYDMRGAWLEAKQKGQSLADGRGHYPDTYKKPNHPTFSNESKYNGEGGAKGGTWSTTPDGRPMFTPGRDLSPDEARRLQEYFAKVEPDAVLNLPGGRPQGMITGDNLPQAGGQPQAAGTLLDRPRTRQNETVTTTRKIQSAQGQRVPNDGRPTAMQDIAALKRLAQQTRLPVKQSELLNYMEANERKVDQYYNAYFRRFHRWPSGAERGRLLQIAQAKETLRHNQEIENRLAMNTAEAIRKNAYAEEAARVAAMQKSSDTVKSEDKPEKFTLGEPNEEGTREVIGGNGLLTGYSAMTISTDGRHSPVVYVPNGIPRPKVSQVIDFMSEHGFGNPINTSNGTTEWIQGQTKDGNLRTISFLEAMRMAEEGAAKVKAEEAARTAAANAKVKADRKDRLARYRKDYALYKKDPQALAREVEERKKAMDK